MNIYTKLGIVFSITEDAAFRTFNKEVIGLIAQGRSDGYIVRYCENLIHPERHESK